MSCRTEDSWVLEVLLFALQTHWLSSWSLWPTKFIGRLSKIVELKEEPGERNFTKDDWHGQLLRTSGTSCNQFWLGTSCYLIMLEWIKMSRSTLSRIVLRKDKKVTRHTCSMILYRKIGTMRLSQFQTCTSFSSWMNLVKGCIELYSVQFDSKLDPIFDSRTGCRISMSFRVSGKQVNKIRGEALDRTMVIDPKTSAGQEMSYETPWMGERHETIFPADNFLRMHPFFPLTTFF